MWQIAYFKYAKPHGLPEAIFYYPWKQFINGAPGFSFKIIFKFQSFFPAADGSRMQAIPDGDVYKPFFQKAEPGGQGQ